MEIHQKHQNQTDTYQFQTKAKINRKKNKNSANFINCSKQNRELIYRKYKAYKNLIKYQKLIEYKKSTAPFSKFPGTLLLATKLNLYRLYQKFLWLFDDQF